MDIYVTCYILGWILILTMCMICIVGIAMVVWSIVYAIERHKDRKKFFKELVKRRRGNGDPGNANTCISCGAIIPEGSWTCPNCESR
jgi:hypothetical protein